MTPVGVPPAGTDLASKGLAEIGPRPADRHELALAAFAQGLTDALANDIARADEAPSHGQNLSFTAS